MNPNQRKEMEYSSAVRYLSGIYPSTGEIDRGITEVKSNGRTVYVSEDEGSATLVGFGTFYPRSTDEALDRIMDFLDRVDISEPEH